MSSGFYSNSICDPPPTTATEVMMRQDRMEEEHQRWKQRYYNLPPIYQGFTQEYYRCTPPYEPPHYCKAVPEHLVNYYQQLLNYYKQSGYKPKEKLCCSLNNLKIKY
jgi:hypothetical protein